jgi:hypothetical protein
LASIDQEMLLSLDWFTARLASKSCECALISRPFSLFDATVQACNFFRLLTKQITERQKGVRTHGVAKGLGDETLGMWVSYQLSLA